METERVLLVVTVDVSLNFLLKVKKIYFYILPDLTLSYTSVNLLNIQHLSSVRTLFLTYDST